MDKQALIEGIVNRVKGEFATETERQQALFSYEMGEKYAQTRRFDNSRYYHNYSFRMDDGNVVSSSAFFSIFTTRNQTGAYMDAEKIVNDLMWNGKTIPNAEGTDPAEAAGVVTAESASEAVPPQNPAESAARDRLFHLVRDQRFGINGVFKAALSPGEPHKISYTDYVLVIASFCAGVINTEVQRGA